MYFEDFFPLLSRRKITLWLSLFVRSSASTRALRGNPKTRYRRCYPITAPHLGDDDACVLDPLPCFRGRTNAGGGTVTEGRGERRGFWARLFGG
jgi:hypothetical protein